MRSRSLASFLLGASHAPNDPRTSVCHRTGEPSRGALQGASMLLTRVGLLHTNYPPRRVGGCPQVSNTMRTNSWCRCPRHPLWSRSRVMVTSKLRPFPSSTRCAPSYAGNLERTALDSVWLAACDNGRIHLFGSDCTDAWAGGWVGRCWYAAAQCFGRRPLAVVRLECEPTEATRLLGVVPPRLLGVVLPRLLGVVLPRLRSRPRAPVPVVLYVRGRFIAGQDQETRPRKARPRLH